MGDDRNDELDDPGRPSSQEEANKQSAERLAASQEAKDDAEIQGAKEELGRAQDRLDDAEEDAVDPAKAAKPGAGKDPKLPEGGTLHEQQIADGDAPLAPGPFKDVDPDDAQRAKENRGNG